MARHDGWHHSHDSALPDPTDLPTHPGTTPASLTRLNAAAATRLGVNPAAYAHLLGLAPEHLDDDRYRIPASTSVRIWELMTLQAPWPHVSLYMAQVSTLGTFGLWDYLLTQAATPLEGVRDAADFLATAADASTETLRIQVDEQHVTISHVNAADLTDDVASAIRGYSLSLFRQRMCESTRRDIIPVKVALAARAPRNHQPLMEMYGTRAVDFASPVNAITFKAADLTAPQPHASGLSAHLRRHARLMLTEAIPLHDWLDVFRTALRTAPDPEDLTLRAMAQRLSVSTRTLQRRLEEHHTSWSDELQALRRDNVLRLLTTTDMTLDAIARRTGYADTGGLRRAVHRWTGQPVSAVRASDVGADPHDPADA
ncbi:AraC family transcriptional regulator ligand-binding domain-containing protein [Streptomyces sp. NPDC058290]|uniref:AraC family transcriptional regulator n=1 Tax=Streptomyces sp. NPDC058290 TaxID=3346426 RepID=UPI0036EC7C37